MPSGVPMPEPIGFPAGVPIDGQPAERSGFDFSTTPNVKIFHPSYHYSPPTGPGFYSFFDQINGIYRDAPPKYGYSRMVNQPQPFFDADFRYLDNPDNTDRVPTDALKRIKFADDFMFSTGGQAWIRYMDITNQGLGTKNSNEDLLRVRSYIDVWYKDWVRVYAEFISATEEGQSAAPGPYDINRADFLNLFMDVKVFDLDNRPVYARVGRQELVFGSQRLVSNVDFLNTRRTFQGVRATYRGENWDYDAWWARPVVVNPTQVDSWDLKQNFVGSWATYHPNKTDLVDLYYLYYDNQNHVALDGITRSPTILNTFGSRYFSNANRVLWDLEGAMQLGSVTSQNLVAGMATTGIGYHFKDAPMSPSTWLYYDYASGSQNPGHGADNTFNQLFAFGHNYLGALDVVGRQNIQDISTQNFLYPTDWLTVQVQYHQLWLASAKDALYNSQGLAIRRSATGADGADVGGILNFIFNFHLTANQDIQVGYGHLYGGTFLQKTGTSQMDYFYLTYNIKW